ncbi:MAG: chromosome partitioning protein ParB, partial [Tomitella sp.]|nr:chromosome partitioning protein ParB [Tomitella sp.]
AARRQAAARFSTEHQPGSGGGANCAPPSPGSSGKTRAQAAAMIPGGASHTTLDKISYLQQIADDPAQPAELREQVTGELERIDAGAAVDPLYRQVRDLTEAAREHREADLHQLAADALVRVKTATTKKRTSTRSAPPPADNGAPVPYPVRAFVLTWTELAQWWTHYDAEQLATELTDEQIESFLTAVGGTSRFAEELRAARDRLADDGAVTARGHLRAL